MNILILSCGTRNKIVQYFKTAFLNDLVVAADSSPHAPALYEADVNVVVPRVSDDQYLPYILDLCERYQIKGLISLIDPELEVIAKNKDRFESIGVSPMISDLGAITSSYNKLEFANLLDVVGVEGPKTYGSWNSLIDSIEQSSLNFPLMMKPICGSASERLHRVDCLDDCEALFDRHPDLVAQEWIPDDEYGVDCYIDMLSGQVAGMFIKKKLLMRAGETDKSISCKNVHIQKAIERFLGAFPYRFSGAIDIDVFFDGNRCLISEVNPRFGGGYPHAYECGIDFPSMYRRNLEGKSNPTLEELLYEDDVVMMKYSEVKMILSSSLSMPSV